MNDNLKFEMASDTVGQLTLSQPAKRNALNAKMWADLPSVLDIAAKTEGLKAIIIRGEGDHFASGADISEFGTLYATPESSAQISADIAAGMDALAEFPMPTIALIRGACVGGGCGLALSCDLRFADTTSKFAITPAKLGLVYPFGDVQRLIETVGLSNAKDILLSARLIKAEEAHEIGLVNKLHGYDDLEEAVINYAQNMTALSAESLKVTKKMFAQYQAGQFSDSEDTKAWFLAGFSSNDFKEGYTAFMEKRKPRF